MSSWIFLCTINYQRAIMYQGLISNCQFQVLIKKAAILKSSNCRNILRRTGPMVILGIIKCLSHCRIPASEETKINSNVSTSYGTVSLLRIREPRWCVSTLQLPKLVFLIFFDRLNIKWTKMAALGSKQTACQFYKNSTLNLHGIITKLKSPRAC